MKIQKIRLLAIFALLLSSCANDDKTSKKMDTVSSGEISISVDESFAPIIKAELDVFHALYPKAKIKPFYLSEGEAIRYLIDDSVRLVIATRELTESELVGFKAINLNIRKTKIAIDAVALIVNNSNQDTTFKVSQINDIISGKSSYWKQLDSKGLTDVINVVFDGQNSSTARYMKELSKVEHLPKTNFFALNTNKEVIDYVSKNKNALGVIGVSWVSDLDDKQTEEFLNKIKVVSVASDNTTNEEYEYVKPYQAYIAQSIYPLTRYVYVLSREARPGLGTGFAAFVAGDKGQRIILKSGLVPATMPVRLVNISK